MRTPSKTRATAIQNPTHIYIVGFDNGIVKVGRTSDPHNRFITLASQHRKTGATITNRWVSEHPNPRQAEFHLRRIGRGFFTWAHGAEYFFADFDTFLAKVEQKFEDYGQPLGNVLDSLQPERVA